MADDATIARTVQDQREVQDQVAESDARRPQSKSGAMQAGARRYPEPPLPQQHQTKPGVEADLDPQPMYDAPFYKGSGKLEDKVAIITGGDSGIGRAVAVLFAREGADVAIALSRRARGRRGDQKARSRRRAAAAILIAGRRARPRLLLRARWQQTVEAFGKLDVLVNNAAFQVHVNDFEDLTEEHFDTTLKTNLYGYFHMAQAAVPHMKPGSAIVNTGSVTGLLGNKDLLDYSMTKGGIHAFTRSLATHLIAAGHPRQRRGAGTGVDAAQPGRQGGRRRRASSAPTRR